MTPLDVRGALLRRWYLLTAGLVATGALLWLAVTYVGPTHEVKSSVMLLPPRLTVVDYPNQETNPNPFLRLDGMDPVVSVLITRMTSKEVSDQLLAGEPSGSYEITQDVTSQAPIIIVTASASTDVEAERIRDTVTGDLPRELEDLQAKANVPSNARIVLADLVADRSAVVSWRGLVRILILIAAAGTVGTVLLIGAVDGIARTRKQARARRLAGPHDDAESAHPNPESEPPFVQPIRPDPGPSRPLVQSIHHTAAEPSVEHTKTARGLRKFRVRSG